MLKFRLRNYLSWSLNLYYFYFLNNWFNLTHSNLALDVSSVLFFSLCIAFYFLDRSIRFRWRLLFLDAFFNFDIFLYVFFIYQLAIHFLITLPFTSFKLTFNNQLFPVAHKPAP